jgi:hypothetical protein
MAIISGSTIPQTLAPDAASNPTLQKQKKLASSNIFSALPTETSEPTLADVNDMLSGASMAPTAQLANESLARGAQQARAQAGGQAAPVLGQGAAIRSQQGVEQNVLGTMADTQLKIAQLAEQTKAQGVGYAISLEQLGQQKMGQDMNAVQMLISQGGAANLAQASAKLAQMYPGMQFDFTRTLNAQNAQDFNSAMSAMAKLVASGVPQSQAVDLLTQQGIGQQSGLNPTQMGQMYNQMLIQGNPISATLQSFQSSGLGADAIKQMSQTYLQNMTGSEMTQGADGKWHVVPADGYTTVSSLANVQPGQMVKFSVPMSTPGGQTVPPGKYTIISADTTHETYDSWSGDNVYTTTTHTYAVSSDGTKYELKTSVGSPKKEQTTASQYYTIADPGDFFHQGS